MAGLFLIVYTFDSFLSHHTLCQKPTKLAEHVSSHSVHLQLTYYLASPDHVISTFKACEHCKVALFWLNPFFTSWTNLISEFDVDMFLKPACSSANKFRLSRNHFGLVSIILSKTFVRVEVRAVGQYDPISSVAFPGFNIGMITAFVQSAGRFILLVQNLLYIKSSVSVAFGPRFLINSGNILSVPGCFLLVMFVYCILYLLHYEFCCEQFFQIAISSICTLSFTTYHFVLLSIWF